MKKIAAALGLVALVGCGPHGDAKEAVKRVLVDPDSAKFSSLADGKDKGDVCGFVNAKNRMGGFVGDTPFVYQAASGRAVMVQAARTEDFRSVWYGIQANTDFMERLTEVRQKCQSVEQWRDVCGQTIAQHRLCSPIADQSGAVFDLLRREFE